MSDALYEHYVEFKNWSESPDPGDKATFEDFMSSSGKSGSLVLLEIGFGDGSFMDWARSAGHNITGIEIIPELVSMARSRGHMAYRSGDHPPDPRRYDAVIALDVLEHLDISQFAEFFKTADRLLARDGIILARFPNGDSPFFGPYQHGDYTHQKPLSWRSLHQVAIRYGFEVRKKRNPRPVSRKLGRRIKQLCAYVLRDTVETFIGLAYFGHRTPMDPNIIVVMSRKAL